MSIKSLFAAAALAAIASPALANNVVDAPPFSGLTSTFAAVHSAGSFVDTFTFTLPGITSASVSVTTIGAGAADIDFTSATLNGLPLALTTDAGGFVELLYTPSPLSVSGPLTLIINGVSGTNASYSGTLSVTTAIPEPETLALLLGGLGVVNLVVRRRRVH